MATWPSSPASTANLDAGTDKPSLARADLKTNVDNTNAIIEMFNISSPSNNQILKYNSTTTKFELASDSSGIATVSADATPSLGGNLNVNGNSIVSTSNGNITVAPNGSGNVFVTPSTGYIKLAAVKWPAGAGTNGYVLKTDGTDQLSWAAESVAISTGVTGLGTSVATALAVNVGSSGAVVVNGGALGTPSSGTLSSCTVDGTNSVGYRKAPAVGTKTTSYTLTTSDVGKYVQVGSGGSITIPDATFSEGDIISIVNNHSAAITITCTITTAYISGTDTDKATVSLATRGLCSIIFLSGTVCVIAGSVS